MEKVTLFFGGKEYVIPAEKTWGLIEAIEEVVTITWLAPKIMDLATLPMAKVYRAYAAALTYAGAKGVTTESIRDGVDHQKFFQMAVELFNILQLASPPIGLALGNSSPTTDPETIKKKPTTKRQKRVSSRG